MYDLTITEKNRLSILDRCSSSAILWLHSRPLPPYTWDQKSVAIIKAGARVVAYSRFSFDASRTYCATALLPAQLPFFLDFQRGTT